MTKTRTTMTMLSDHAPGARLTEPNGAGRTASSVVSERAQTSALRAGCPPSLFTTIPLGFTKDPKFNLGSIKRQLGN